MKITAQTVKMVEQDRGALLRKGAYKLFGTPGNPARVTSPTLNLSGVVIVVDAKSQGLLAVARGSEDVKIKCDVVPTKGGLPMHFEATCEQATFDATSGEWSLEGDVKGFYETAHGRKDIDSDMVTIARKAASIAVTQQVTDNVGGNTVGRDSRAAS